MILFIVGWLLGIMLGSFFIIQPLIILFFSIPNSIKLKGMGAVSNNSGVIIRDLISLVFQLAILIVSYYFIAKSNNLKIGFYVGVGIVLVLGISKVFKNTNNVADYMEKNFIFIHPDFMNQYLNQVIEHQPESNARTKHIATLMAKMQK